jgi:hypothetical protein
MARKTTLSVLIAARKLIAPKGAWTTCAWAKDKTGKAVDPESEKAVCYCMSGALIKVAARGSPVGREARMAIRAANGGRGPIEINDAPRRTHKQVLAAFDRAIAKLRKRRAGHIRNDS